MKIVPTEEMVIAGAKMIADSPGIDAPKLHFGAWMGLSRKVIEAAIAAAPVAQEADLVRRLRERADAHRKLHECVKSLTINLDCMLIDARLLDEAAAALARSEVTQWKRLKIDCRMIAAERLSTSSTTMATSLLACRI